MSYDITNWKTTKLDNLIIPIEALYNENIDNKNWIPNKPIIIDLETNMIEICGGCGQTISGYLKDGKIHVIKLDLKGEGSNNWRYYSLDNAFKQSIGILEATLIWEGGDSITKFKLNNGELTEIAIEI